MGFDKETRIDPSRRVPLFGLAWLTSRTEQNAKLKWGLEYPNTNYCPLRGDIRKNWNDTEKISMAPAQG